MLQKTGKDLADRSAFVYTGERRQYLAFPLGGIGSGGVSISGGGRLIDWSIRNRPALQGYNGYSHFAIKAEQRRQAGRCARAQRPLRRRCRPARRARRKFDGFGLGAKRRLAGRRAAFRRRRLLRPLPGRRSRVSRRALSRAGADDGVQPVHSAQRPRFLDAGRAVRLRDRQRHRRADRLHARPARSATTAATAASIPSRNGRPQRAAFHLGRSRTGRTPSAAI